MTSRSSQPKTSHSYYVVMIDYGQRGLEAIVCPEITRREVVARIASREYRDIAFIHHVDGLFIEDCTDELMHDAGVQLEAAE